MCLWVQVGQEGLLAGAEAVLESPLHQPQVRSLSPVTWGDPANPNISRIVAVAAPVLLCPSAHTGSSKGDREAVTLAVVLQGLLWSSVDPAGSVLVDANISLLVPLCSAEVQTAPWSLHMKLQEILHCRAVEEATESVAGHVQQQRASICGGAFCWQNALSTSRAGCC